MSNDTTGPVVVRGFSQRRPRPPKSGNARQWRVGSRLVHPDLTPRSGTVSADPRQSKRLVRLAGGQARDPKRVRGKWTVKPGTDAAMPAAPGGNMMPRGPILSGSALDTSIGDGRANAISALVGGAL